LLGRLPRRFDCLAATAGEEHLVEVAWRVRAQSLGKFHSFRMGEPPHREVRELACLFRSNFGELRPTMAYLYSKQAGQAVQVALTVRVVDVRTVTSNDGRDGTICVRRHAREVHPQVVIRRS
jgi:thymidylate synthase ThyX